MNHFQNEADKSMRASSISFLPWYKLGDMWSHAEIANISQNGGSPDIRVTKWRRDSVNLHQTLSNLQIDLFPWATEISFRIFLLGHSVLIALIKGDYMPTWGKDMPWPAYTSSEMERCAELLALTACSFIVREFMCCSVGDSEVQNTYNYTAHSHKWKIVPLSQKAPSKTECLCRHAFSFWRVFKRPI